LANYLHCTHCGEEKVEEKHHHCNQGEMDNRPEWTKTITQKI